MALSFRSILPTSPTNNDFALSSLSAPGESASSPVCCTSRLLIDVRPGDASVTPPPLMTTMPDEHSTAPCNVCCPPKTRNVPAELKDDPSLSVQFAFPLKSSQPVRPTFTVPAPEVLQLLRVSRPCTSIMPKFWMAKLAR